MHKKPCILLSIVCSIGSGPILNQGKQGLNQGNIRDNDFTNLTDTLCFIIAKLFICDVLKKSSLGHGEGPREI